MMLERDIATIGSPDGRPEFQEARAPDPIAALFGPTLVVAPHPDDEVLGAGGTIARLARAGVPVSVSVVTRGRPPRFEPAQVERVRSEAMEAHARLGVRETLWLDLPAAELGSVPHADLNASVGEAVRSCGPRTLLLPHVGDIHLDHQLVFAAGLVAARPHGGSVPARVLAYETLSETNWNAPYVTPGFQPQAFVDIAETLDAKVEAMRCFSSQLRPAPNERSVEAMRALAILRGATVHRSAAEAFVVVRETV